MSYCLMCAMPSLTRCCSMCYGDVDHGNGGYYRDYLEEIERESQIERQLSEEAEINYYRNKGYLIIPDNDEIPF